MASPRKHRGGAHSTVSASNDFVARFHSEALSTTTGLSVPPVAVFDTFDGVSARDSNPQAFASTGRTSSHSRSASHPNPSMMLQGDRRREPQIYLSSANQGYPGATSAMHGQNPSPNKTDLQSRARENATGPCMACGSMMRWPADLPVFKCTICLTINDLLPLENSQKSGGRPRWRRSASQSSSTIQESAFVAPISLERSRRIASQCLCTYLRHKLGQKSPSGPDCVQARSADEPMPKHLATSRASEHYRPDYPISLARQGGGVVHDNRYVFDEQPTLKHNPLRPSTTLNRASFSLPENSPFHQHHVQQGHQSQHRRTASKESDARPRIFKPLEDYLVSCFSSIDCINSSFGSQNHRVISSAEVPVKRKPVPARSTPIRRPGQNSRESADQEATLSDLDPKVLLLGDVAENGSWWSGLQRDPRPIDTPPVQERIATTLVSPKSPKIDWDILGTWYTEVINVARRWFEVYEEMRRDEQLGDHTDAELRTVETDLLHAQDHVQNVLLKATENLLKRPGRPIRHPADLRFLLIILENPLIHGSIQCFPGFLQTEDDTPGTKQRDSSVQLEPSLGAVSGRHSGIIKRLIGLIANSSDECHNQLTVWIARYNRSHFIRLKELMSSYITYRMIRQNEKKGHATVDITGGLIPEIHSGRSGAYLHDEIATPSARRQKKGPTTKPSYADDWQIRATAQVLALFFTANNLSGMRDEELCLQSLQGDQEADSRSRTRRYGQVLPTSDFYVSMADCADLIGDFEAWESRRTKFAFCQYPFLLSVWAKTRILEHDAHRQMQSKARDAFFDSVISRKAINQFLSFNIRRHCLVEDSLTSVSEVLGSGGEDLKKRLRITFQGEEGIDGGGLRKEWFLLLVREVFNPDHGMFLYDEESQYCYFNPNSFETSDQFFLVGVVLGLAIFNSTILDVALPPVVFRKLLASAPAQSAGSAIHPRQKLRYTLADLADYRPHLAHGLKQLLDFEGDVETTFCLDFVVDVDKYGAKVQVPLCDRGERRAVNNENRREYVELYVEYVLDTAVRRQFEPFKRGFYTVCGGNAFSLFRPEEIELLVRGSDEPLDVASLRALAEYDNWGCRQPDGDEPVVSWFWESFEEATPRDQRKLLLFITGSDRVPATGAAMLPIRLSCLGEDCGRFPIARTCFNFLSLFKYGSREKLEKMLWTAVHESEGFGLK